MRAKRDITHRTIWPPILGCTGRPGPCGCTCVLRVARCVLCCVVEPTPSQVVRVSGKVCAVCTRVHDTVCDGVWQAPAPRCVLTLSARGRAIRWHVGERRRGGRPSWASRTGWLPGCPRPTGRPPRWACSSALQNGGQLHKFGAWPRNIYDSFANLKLRPPGVRGVRRRASPPRAQGCARGMRPPRKGPRAAGNVCIIDLARSTTSGCLLSEFGVLDSGVSRAEETLLIQDVLDN